MARVPSPSLARTLFLVIGGGIGAGVFGLPVVFAQAGLIWGSVLYWGIVLVALVIHVAYAKLQEKAGSRHDLAGIARKSLGKPGWLLGMIGSPLSIYGVSLIYLLLGAQFVSSLSGYFGGPTSIFGWQVALWILFAWGAHKGIKGVANFERPTMAVLVVGLVLASFIALLSGHGASLMPVSTFETPSFIGVVFFACIALPLVAETMEFNRQRPTLGMRGVIIGTLVVACLKWIFAVCFAGVAQGGVLDINLYNRALPHAIGWLIPLIGICAISGSAVSNYGSLATLYRDEMKLRPFFAWTLTVLPSLVFIYTSHYPILPLMALLGSCVTALNALIVCVAALMTERLHKKRFMPRTFMYAAFVLSAFAFVNRFLFLHS